MDIDKPYTITTEGGADSEDISVLYENYYSRVTGDAINGIDFDPEGSVSLTDNEGAYALALTANDGYSSLPWYTITVSGSEEAQNPSLTVTDEGYIFSGEELSNIKVIANNDNETKELTFDSEKTTVLITNDKDILVIKEDTDNDGGYDYVIADSNGNTYEKATETTTAAKKSSGSGSGSSYILNSENTTVTEAATESELSADVSVTVGSTEIRVGGRTYKTDAASYIQTESNSVLVPLRFAALAILGENVDEADASKLIAWNAAAKTVTVTAGGKTLSFTAGSNIMTVNGKKTVMDNGVKAEIKDGRMFIPFRALGEALGATVEWNAATKTATYKVK